MNSVQIVYYHVTHRWFMISFDLGSWLYTAVNLHSCQLLYKAKTGEQRMGVNLSSVLKRYSLCNQKEWEMGRNPWFSTWPVPLLIGIWIESWQCGAQHSQDHSETMYILFAVLPTLICASQGLSLGDKIQKTFSSKYRTSQAGCLKATCQQLLVVQYLHRLKRLSLKWL